MIRAIVSDLFDTAKRRKVSNRICINDLALHSKSRRNRRHILFRDTRVDNLVGQLFPERL